MSDATANAVSALIFALGALVFCIMALREGQLLLHYRKLSGRWYAHLSAGVMINTMLAAIAVISAWLCLPGH